MHEHPDDVGLSAHDSTWCYDIADMVAYGWDDKNNGAKLVQVPFYPVDTMTCG